MTIELFQEALIILPAVGAVFAVFFGVLFAVFGRRS